MKPVFYFFILFLTINSSLAFATVALSAPDIEDILFEPGFEASYDFVVFSTRTIRIEVQGDLVEYASVSKQILDLSKTKPQETVTLSLNFPEQIPPGKHEIYFAAIETVKDPESEGAEAVGAMRARITVIAPVPEEYIEANFDTEFKRTSTSIPINIHILNLGIESLYGIYGDVSIIRDNKIETFTTMPIDVLSAQRGVLTGYWTNLEPPEPNYYNASATIYYGNNKKTEIKEVLKIGDLDIRIDNFTKDFIIDRVNEVNIDVFNLWGGTIKNVYFEYSIYNESNSRIAFSKSTPGSLNRFRSTRISNFINIDDFDTKKEYTANVTVFFENKSTTAIGKVNFDRERINLFEMVFTGSAGQTLLIILIVMILLINVIFLIILSKKHKKKNEKN